MLTLIQAPTIFPIVFASVVGRALTLIGRLKAERGVELGVSLIHCMRMSRLDVSNRVTEVEKTLRCLLNTKTVSDAVQNQLVFRNFSVISTFLLLLWVLSPVGSQASLRALTKVNHTTDTTVPLRYVDSGPLGQVYVGEWSIAQSDALNSGRPGTIIEAYSAALMQTLSNKRGSRDAWGNTKIPRIDKLNTSLSDSDGWLDASGQHDVESYASLFGLPIVGLPKAGTANFSVETSYVSLTCPKVSYVNRNNTSPPLNGFNITCITCALSTSASNDIELFPERKTLWSDRAAFFIGERAPNLTEQQDPKFSVANTIRFLSPTPDNRIVTSDCTVKQELVEARIHCTEGNCATTHIRPSTTDHRNANYTVFDYWAKVVLDEITLASQHGTGGLWSSASEYFISDSSRLPLLAKSLGDIQQLVDLGAVAPAMFAARASMLLNSLIQLWMSGSAFAGELSTDISTYGPDHIPATGLTGYNAPDFGHPNIPATGDIPDGLLGTFRNVPFIGANTNASSTKFEEVYNPSTVWLILLFLSSMVMSFVGIIGITCGMKTLAPDRFDSVVSQTYDNPYFECPPGGSGLDVTERAKLLQKVKVMIGNVEQNGDVGKLGFATVENAQPVETAKFYE